ncbi:DNA-formamidopyrimidine glycosylase [Patescibacteria group bacterium]|nr:DNA-formamidopyrimidine glycosylase [Patescibacteria group bacterium]
MPELPEIETIKLGLRKYLIGRKIKGIEVTVPKLFAGTAEQIVGAKIINLKRIGKGLIIELNNDFVLAVHLKMTGQLVYRDEKTKNLILSKKVGGETLPSRYTHVILSLDKGGTLFYNDLRQFGWIKVLKKEEVMQMPFFKEMGPEPKVGDDLVGKELTLEYFRKVVQEGNSPIKIILMDQKRIGGIGNIYANDALFKAGIDPRRKGKTLTEVDIKKLYDSIFYIIKKSLEYGGSSDENFVNALGQEGNYQNHSLVYGKKGKDCPKGNGKIEKIFLGGRGTFFCPNCQH